MIFAHCVYETTGADHGEEKDDDDGSELDQHDLDGDLVHAQEEVVGTGQPIVHTVAVLYDFENDKGADVDEATDLHVAS